MPKTKIPILDLTGEVESLWSDLMPAVEDVIRSGQFILGSNVTGLEEELAAYTGSKFAVGCNSGTDALVIALRAMGIQPGDEVITTPFTFVATTESIVQVGATPVFVDIEPDTLNLDVSQIEAAITDKTSAILPVHLFGHAADMTALMDIATRHNLKVLEDVAQAFGGTYGDAPLGTIGMAGALSFFPTKNLGAFGDAGMIITDDPAVADQASMLRVHGSKERYRNELHGYNSRLDALQAAILRVKLPHLDRMNAHRRTVAAGYAERLAAVDEVAVPVERDYATHVYHQYTIRVPGAHRDALVNHLNEEGIGTIVYYPVPIHRLPVYADTFGHLALPETEKAAAEVLSLPMGPHVDDDALDQIGAAVKDYFAKV